MLERVIFIQTHSDDSDKAKNLLINSEVNFATIIQNSYDQPKLVSPSSRCPYEGYLEILEYVGALPSKLNTVNF